LVLVYTHAGRKTIMVSNIWNFNICFFLVQSASGSDLPPFEIKHEEEDLRVSPLSPHVVSGDYENAVHAGTVRDSDARRCQTSRPTVDDDQDRPVPIPTPHNFTDPVPVNPSTTKRKHAPTSK